MSVKGNKIVFPVSPDDIREVIGVDSYDTGTLCTSDQINPCSLIAPLWTNIPGLIPSDNNFKFLVSNLGIMGIEYSFFKGCWGYYVPYVGNPDNISKVYKVTWNRAVPDSNSYYSLLHFDGYRHDAVPSMPIDANVIAGKEITVGIYASSVADQDITSVTGENKGGVVSVANVLADVVDNLYFGCSLFTLSGIDDANVTLVGHYMATGAGKEIKLIKTGVTANSNTTYLIIPWATDKPYNGVIQSGARFFGLKFAKDIETSIRITVPMINVYFDTYTRSGTTITIKAGNQFGVPKTLGLIKLTFVYQDPGNNLQNRQKTVSLSGSIEIPKKTGNTDGTATQQFNVADSDFSNAITGNRLLYWSLSGICDGEQVNSMQVTEKDLGGGFIKPWTGS